MVNRNCVDSRLSLGAAVDPSVGWGAFARAFPAPQSLPSFQAKGGGGVYPLMDSALLSAP
jgi:hypothetical protein